MEVDAEIYPDLRLQYLCAALSTTLGAARPDAPGKPQGWRLTDFTLPWHPTEPRDASRPPAAAPPAAPPLPDAFAAAADDPDVALLWGDAGTTGTMSPDQSSAYVGVVFGLYGGTAPAGG